MTKGQNKRVRKFKPEAPEARDEGPRLLPLKLQHDAGDWGSHLLQLADRALNDGKGRSDGESSRARKRRTRLNAR